MMLREFCSLVGSFSYAADVSFTISVGCIELKKQNNSSLQINKNDIPWLCCTVNRSPGEFILFISVFLSEVKRSRSPTSGPDTGSSDQYIESLFSLQEQAFVTYWWRSK